MLLLALLDVSVSAYGGGLGELRLDGLDLGLVLCIGLPGLETHEKETVRIGTLLAMRAPSLVSLSMVPERLDPSSKSLCSRDRSPPHPAMAADLGAAIRC